MADRELCSNGWSKSKVRYKTRAQAEKAARKTTSGLALHIYACRFCHSWHLSSEAPRVKTTTPPSSSKLRRRLENTAREIAATERRLTAAERAYAAELDYVHRETARLFGAEND